MVASAIALLYVTLALFGVMRYRAARSGTNRDLYELNDAVDGLLKREATRLARERASLRRAVEGSGEGTADTAPARPVGESGGVVRKDIFPLNSEPERQRGRKA
jgi:hypothetical protein